MIGGQSVYESLWLIYSFSHLLFLACVGVRQTSLEDFIGKVQHCEEQMLGCHD